MTLNHPTHYQYCYYRIFCFTIISTSKLQAKRLFLSFYKSIFFLILFYRRISLPPFMSQLLDYAVFIQVSEFFHDNNLFSSYQSGFGQGHSTKLLSCQLLIPQLARSAGQSSIIILLDLFAAFDMVNHQILHSTLLELGISGSVILWFLSNLTERSFKVSWRGRGVQTIRVVNWGASGFSAWPSSLFIYALGTVVGSHALSYHCYADDTQLFLPTWWHNHLNTDISLSCWYLPMDEELPPSAKSVHDQTCPASPSLPRQISMQFDSITLVPTSSARNLGVIIDKALCVTYLYEKCFINQYIRNLKSKEL